MLTKRQNLLETIHGGKPDRYVNQYEAFAMLFNNPHSIHDPAPEYGKPPVKNAWGITKVWPEGTPGAFPIHDEEHIVCKPTRPKVTIPPHPHTHRVFPCGSG